MTGGITNITAPRRSRSNDAPSPSRRGASRSAGFRITGLDLARFVALIGMMAAHVWTYAPDGSYSVAEQVVSGKAAALFAVLAGVGITLTSRRALAEGRVGAARWNLFGRGLAIILIGLTLGIVGGMGGILVILVYYGVMFWVAIPMLRWPSTALLIGAGVLAVGWPPLSAWLREGMMQPFELGGASWFSLTDPAAFGRGLFLTGTYPVPTWIVYAMVGMVIGRLVLAAQEHGDLRRLGLRLTAIGSAVAVAAWGASLLLLGPLGGRTALIATRPDLDPALLDRLLSETGMGAPITGDLWWLASATPHTGTLFDLGLTTGIALVVIGLCLLLGTALRGTPARLLEPLRRAGAAPLTVYTAHIIAAAVTVLVILSGGMLDPSEERPWYTSSAGLWGLHVLGAILIGVTLMALDRRGPMETFVSWFGRLFTRLFTRSRKG
ncbi:hypothetical protein J2Y69_001517 [Microbacterium resistens]|uniref:Heparan-alpha-glucosaminide N-acetyltransferase catalytic domain-containing protein n=1 Tax=Microbacterium resistens TaxID=156977 RepID=A0ABU1SDE6_9MICO|nr:heparan-alpha-glucosaminide N-acetyltransferase domain-containing protein [Microbacterium resistens]MDR6866918.1 hypothetical protein [Microbacterium resistens]